MPNYGRGRSAFAVRPQQVRSKLACAPPDERDGEHPYTRAQLLRMDNRFRQRMLRAIERGREQPPDGENPERAA